MKIQACLLAVWGILIYQIKAIMIECLEISPAGHFKRYWVWRELLSPPPPLSLFPHSLSINEIHVLLKIKNRRDDAYWPEGKRVAMEDRYRPDFPRPDHRFHDFDHRDRGQYQDHVADRSAPTLSCSCGRSQLSLTQGWVSLCSPTSHLLVRLPVPG